MEEDGRCLWVFISNDNQQCTVNVKKKNHVELGDGGNQQRALCRPSSERIVKLGTRNRSFASNHHLFRCRIVEAVEKKESKTRILLTTPHFNAFKQLVHERMTQVNFFFLS